MQEINYLADTLVSRVEHLLLPLYQQMAMLQGRYEAEVDSLKQQAAEVKQLVADVSVSTKSAIDAMPKEVDLLHAAESKSVEVANKIGNECREEVLATVKALPTLSDIEPILDQKISDIEVKEKQEFELSADLQNWLVTKIAHMMVEDKSSSVQHYQLMLDDLPKHVASEVAKLKDDAKPAEIDTSSIVKSLEERLTIELGKRDEATAGQISKAVKEAVEQIELPKPAEPVTEAQIEQMVKSAVTDVSPALESKAQQLMSSLQPDIKKMVKSVVKDQLPRRRDEQSEIPEIVKKGVSDFMTTVQLPPADLMDQVMNKVRETSVSERQVLEWIDNTKSTKTLNEALSQLDEIESRIVDTVVKKIPAPENGTSVTMEDVAPLVDKAVSNAVSAIEVPKPEPVDMDVVCEQVLAKLPKPQPGENGKSVTLEDVAPLVQDLVKEGVSDAVNKLEVPEPESVDLEALEKSVLAKIPKPENGKSVTVEDVAPLVETAVSDAVGKIDIPQPEAVDIEAIEKSVLDRIPTPENGTSVTLDDVSPLLEKAVANAVAQIEVPKPDPVDIEAIEKSVLAKLPAPENGTSVTVDDVAPLIEKSVSEAVAKIEVPQPEQVDVGAIEKSVLAKIPTPENGTSVTIDDVAPLVEKVVAGAVAAINIPEPEKLDLEAVEKSILDRIPKPENGTSVTIHDVAPLVEKSVADAVGRIEVPKPETVDVAAIEKSVLEKIPKPEDGKSVTLEDVLPVVAKAVSEIEVPQPDPVDIAAIENSVLERIPTPENGTSVTIDDVSPLIEKSVADAVSQIQVPKPDVDAICKEVLEKVPTPENGTSVSVEDVLPIIEKTVADTVANIDLPDPVAPDVDAIADAVLAKIPKPEDGKSVTVEQVTPLLVDEMKGVIFERIEKNVRDQVDPVVLGAKAKGVFENLIKHHIGSVPKVETIVKDVLDRLPEPEQVDMELVLTRVDERIEALPKPEDAKPIDPAVIEKMVTDAVEQIPKPEDGKDVDMNAVTDAIQTEVDKAIDALPKPEDGKSVDMDDVQAMVSKSVTQAVLKIPKPAGVDYAIVDEAIEKRVNEAVDKIPKPDDGIDGRDAAAIEVMYPVDPERQYRKGTFASYRGGLIRAHRNTDPVRDGDIEQCGWDVVVNGLAGFTAMRDGKTIRLELEKTIGCDIHELEFNVLEYQGVFKSGETYVPGDAVTWGGSTWICMKKSGEKPGSNDDWKLAVKRGQDGKGEKGDKGDRGKPGQDGRDLTQLGPDGKKW